MSRLLQHLSPERAAKLAPLVARCPTLALTAGATRSSAACGRPSFLIVERGLAAVTACCDGAKRRIVVALGQPGDLLAPPLQAEELVALTDATLTLVPDRVCRALLASADVAALLVDALLAALSDRQGTIANFAAANHCDRLRAKLLQLARAHGRVAPEGVRLDLPLTHGFLAQTTGSARETITCALADLEAQGFLLRAKGRYSLAVPPETLVEQPPSSG